MLEIFKEKKYETSSFSPFIEYLKLLEGTDNISETFKNECSHDEITLKYENGESITILGIKEKDYEWTTIYKINAKGEHYEQIEFMVYTKPTEKRYNRIIIYSAHFEDELYSYIAGSTYYYQDNELIDGMENKRKIELEELPKIFYSKSMNLKELISLADDKIYEFYEVITLLGQEVKELRLKY